MTLAPPLLRRLTLLRVCLCAALTVSLWSGAAEAEERSGRPARSLHLVDSRFPYVRAALGVSLHGDGGGPRFDADATLGGQLIVWRRRTFGVELVPEAGYSYVGNTDEVVSGHYGTFGIGLRLGGRWFGGATTTTLLLGSREDSFDLGLRNGLRLDTLVGILGVEVCHLWRTGDAGDLHSLHIVLAVTLSQRAIRELREALGISHTPTDPFSPP